MKSRRCCCGKCTVDEGDRATVINDIGHEPLGEDGAFCGPVIKQHRRGLNEVVSSEKRILALGHHRCVLGVVGRQPH